GAEGCETKIAQRLEGAVLDGFSLQMGFLIPRGEEEKGVRIQESDHRRLGNADDGRKTGADKRTYKGDPTYRQRHLPSRLRPRLVRDRRHEVRMAGEGHLRDPVVGEISPRRVERGCAVLVQRFPGDESSLALPRIE